MLETVDNAQAPGDHVACDKTAAGAPRNARHLIAETAAQLRIPHLVHFTRCENLHSILQHGLKSVEACKRQGTTAIRNDRSRYDGQPDGISLSIAFPNYRMFYKYRNLAPDADWAVLILKPSILWEKDCAFFRHNAADSRMIRTDREQMKSVRALQDMFAADEQGRDPWLRPYDPTDPQAEVMVYEDIEPRFIEAIAFETREAMKRHQSFLGGIETIWAGAGKGLYGTRRNLLAQ